MPPLGKTTYQMRCIRCKHQLQASLQSHYGPGDVSVQIRCPQCSSIATARIPATPLPTGSSTSTSGYSTSSTPRAMAAQAATPAAQAATSAAQAAQAAAQGAAQAAAVEGVAMARDRKALAAAVMRAADMTSEQQQMARHLANLQKERVSRREGGQERG